VLRGDMPVIRNKPFSPQRNLCVKIILSGKRDSSLLTSSLIEVNKSSLCAKRYEGDDSKEKSKSVIDIFFFNIFFI
jgi:hypothetical protein